MNKLKEGFSKMKGYEKAAFVVGMISSVFVIVLAIMQIFQVWDGAINLCEVFMGIMMITQAILQWNRNRGVAIFSLCVAVFIFVVAIVVFLFRG